MFKKQTRPSYADRIATIEKDLQRLMYITDGNYKQNLRDIAVYKKYNSMPKQDLYSLWTAWDNYYAQSRNSFIADNFRKQVAAYKNKQLGIVKELAEVAKLWSQEADRLKTPSEEDPRVIERRSAVLDYKAMTENKHENSFSL